MALKCLIFILSLCAILIQQFFLIDLDSVCNGPVTLMYDLAIKTRTGGRICFNSWFSYFSQWSEKKTLLIRRGRSRRFKSDSHTTNDWWVDEPLLRRFTCAMCFLKCSIHACKHHSPQDLPDGYTDGSHWKIFLLILVSSSKPELTQTWS